MGGVPHKPHRYASLYVNVVLKVLLYKVVLNVCRWHYNEYSLCLYISKSFYENITRNSMKGTSFVRNS